MKLMIKLQNLTFAGVPGGRNGPDLFRRASFDAYFYVFFSRACHPLHGLYTYTCSYIKL
jgi:hypothetical protein